MTYLYIYKSIYFIINNLPRRRWKWSWSTQEVEIFYSGCVRTAGRRVSSCRDGQ